MEAVKHYVKCKTRVDRAARQFLLNSTINYITPSDLDAGVMGSMQPQTNEHPIYEVITMHEGTCFKIVRLDVYPPRTIAIFKPRLYVKQGNGFTAFSKPNVRVQTA